MVLGFRWDVFFSFAVRIIAFCEILTFCELSNLEHRLGYTWEPEIVTQITGALAFYPFCTSFNVF